MIQRNIGLVLSLIWSVCNMLPTGVTGVNREGVPDRECPLTFNFLLDAYKSCAIYRRDERPQYLNQITATDIILRFQEICSSRARLERCRNIVLEGCSKNHTQTFQAAVDKSLWFCDSDNNIRGSVTLALIGHGDIVPDKQKVKSQCVQDSELSSCGGKILDQSRFSRVKGYGNVIQQSAKVVLGDPQVAGYFKALFHCYLQSVHSRCPQNAIPMVIAGLDHMFWPPKFGVNVSELILDNATGILDQ